MTTEATWARTAQAIADGLDDAVVQGWGPEAATLLRPVRAALDSGPDHEALAVITDQLALASADPCSVRGLYLARILNDVQTQLDSECADGSTPTVAPSGQRVSGELRMSGPVL